LAICNQVKLLTITLFFSSFHSFLSFEWIMRST
jgi:hypothetical protein